MRIYRTTPTRSFSTFANALLRDHTISWCAAGVLMYLLSLPNGARSSIRSLAELRKEGRARIAESLRELEESRYLRRVVAKDRETGRFSTVYEVFDAPYSNGGGGTAVDDQDGNGRNLASGEGKSGGSGPLPLEEKTGGQEPPSPDPAPAPGRSRGRGRAWVRAARAARAPKGSVPEQLRSATELLLSLGRRDVRLALGTAEAVRLAPLVEEWRAAGASDARLRQALTAGLPEDVRSAPGLLANRLRRKLPAPPPPPPVRDECERCGTPLPPSSDCRACAAPSSAPAPETRGFMDAARKGGALVRAALAGAVAPEPGFA
ncbi:hypothetical protein [Streptomyces sp. NPDC095613]|uniref:hypothetical protein n=1 Tax=Streptomyces sp. NPDC095613 TaxID=3155540 RepID=UPI0033301DA8